MHSAGELTFPWNDKEEDEEEQEEFAEEESSGEIDRSEQSVAKKQKVDK